MDEGTHFRLERGDFALYLGAKKKEH